MKFEEIESTWALQQPATPAAVDLAALQGSLRSQLGRRQRLLVIAGVGAGFGLVAMQVLFFLNLRALPIETAWVALGRLLLHQGISLVIVIELARVWLRHRRLAQGRAASVREVVSLSLAGVEGEMADYRLGRWMLFVLAAHSLLSVCLNRPLYGEGWSGFAIRAGLVLAVYGLIGFLGWRHYRRILAPERTRLKETLSQLDQAEG